MKAILVGLGRFGFGWYERLKSRGMLAAVVDIDERSKEKMGNDPLPFYTSLQEALEKEKADFVVNVTPPMVHTMINHIAIDYRIPVLCEKPIAFQFEESIEVIERAEATQVPLMVAENYRRAPSVRKLKQLLEEGAVGRISVVDIMFYRYHERKRNYPVHVLRDIGVHHFDMLRYLSGVEAKAIQANLYKPLGGWQEEGAIMNANAWIEMEGGIRASYTGTIASRGKTTGWPGHWRIEGTLGTLEFTETEITLFRDGQVEAFTDFGDVDSSGILDEFLSGLAEKREFETSGKDYLKTEALVYYAEQSAAEGRVIAMPRVHIPIRVH